MDLSENANFAKLVEDNGIKFIGPPYTAIKIMGDKIISKKHAKNSGVSTIPGVQDEIKSFEDAVKCSKKLDSFNDKSLSRWGWKRYENCL